MLSSFQTLWNFGTRIQYLAHPETIWAGVWLLFVAHTCLTCIQLLASWQRFSPFLFNFQISTTLQPRREIWIAYEVLSGHAIPPSSVADVVKNVSTGTPPRKYEYTLNGFVEVYIFSEKKIHFVCIVLGLAVFAWALRIFSILNNFWK